MQVESSQNAISTKIFHLSEKFVAKQDRRLGVSPNKSTSEDMFFTLLKTFLTSFLKSMALISAETLFVEVKFSLVLSNLLHIYVKFSSYWRKLVIPFNCKKMELYTWEARKRRSQAVHSIYPNSIYTGWWCRS